MVSELTVGTVFGGYRIEAVIGRGGMGLVYRATQIAVDRSVALKLILPEYAADESFRGRFEREARLSAQLDHPNIVPVYEAGERDGQLFLSMQFVEGTDLETVIQCEGPLHPRHVAGIVVQVASALDAAHARELVHRDVKPGNVLLAEEEGRVHAYLTDFGLSKLTTSTSGLTKTGRWVGSVDYAAPEQIQSRATDARTDVYALGCVLFQALSGDVPFPKPREVSKIVAHLSEPVPSLLSSVPDCLEHERLDAIIARAMAKDPAERYSSAGELAGDLAGAAERTPRPTASIKLREAGAGEDVVDRSAPTAG
jgi:serine/threonine-protein kinase